MNWRADLWMAFKAVVITALIAFAICGPVVYQTERWRQEQLRRQLPVNRPKCRLGLALEVRGHWQYRKEVVVCPGPDGWAVVE